MKALKVYVAGIPDGANAEDLRASFLQRGIAARVAVPDDPFGRFCSIGEGRPVGRSCVVEVRGISSYERALNGPPPVVQQVPLACRPFLEAAVVRKVRAYNRPRQVWARGVPAALGQQEVSMALELEFGPVAAVEVRAPHGEIANCPSARHVDYKVTFVDANDARKAGQIRSFNLGGSTLLLEYSECKENVIFQSLQESNRRNERKNNPKEISRFQHIANKKYSPARKNSTSTLFLPSVFNSGEIYSEMDVYNEPLFYLNIEKNSSEYDYNQLKFLTPDVDQNHHLKPTAKAYHLLQFSAETNMRYLKGNLSSQCQLNYRFNTIKLGNFV